LRFAVGFVNITSLTKQREITIMQLSTYNSAHYSNYNEAKASGAVYQTSSSMDATNPKEHVSAYYDAKEIISLIQEATPDSKDLVFGVVINDMFIDIKELAPAEE